MPRVSRPKFETAIDVPPEEIAAAVAEPIDDQPGEDIGEDIAPAQAPAPLSPETTAIIEEQQRAEKASHELLRRAASGHVLTAPERLLLLRTCPPHIARLPIRFESWLTKQVAGMKNIHTLQQRCGTPSEIAAAAEALDAARERRQKDGTKIEQQIASLREQLADMDTTVRKADAAHSRRTTAFDLLREERLLPPHVREELRVLQASTRDDRVAALNAKSVLKYFHHLEQLDPANKPADFQWVLTMLTDWIEDVRVIDLVAPLIEPFTPVAGCNPRKLCPTGWAKYVAIHRVAAEEAAEVLKQIGDYDGRIRAECDLLLGYWLPQDPTA